MSEKKSSRARIKTGKVRITYGTVIKIIKKNDRWFRRRECGCKGEREVRREVEEGMGVTAGRKKGRNHPCLPLPSNLSDPFPPPHPSTFLSLPIPQPAQSRPRHNTPQEETTQVAGRE